MTDFNEHKINVSGGLVPTVTDTPLDKRTRIDTLDDVENIPYPFVGMHFFVTETKKEYIVDSLKSKTVLSIEIPNSVIDEYHLFADTSELEERITEMEGTDTQILAMLQTMNTTLTNIDARLKKEEEAQEAYEWEEI